MEILLTYTTSMLEVRGELLSGRPGITFTAGARSNITFIFLLFRRESFVLSFPHGTRVQGNSRPALDSGQEHLLHKRHNKSSRWLRPAHPGSQGSVQECGCQSHACMGLGALQCTRLKEPERSLASRLT